MLWDSAISSSFVVVDVVVIVGGAVSDFEDPEPFHHVWRHFPAEPNHL